ncbi:probable 1-acylglycerol-3-phosphate O-acyltransferase [Gossypium raimondii]|uniref:probable 1-acylglycerol-3-phosphate O-acyltransferase n=1 Tax=Gossypium raimondii TaxID=29730 RepID=UPI00227A9165|nr:probable 1-acylglycerol-3-phosphate O-acyltransferase [Gossypium raimondii]
MAEQISIAKCPSSKSTTTVSRRRSLWPSVLRWIPTSIDHILASEKRLLSLVKTSYVQEHVNIGSGPSGSKIRWFRSSSNSPRVSFLRALIISPNISRSLPLISLGKQEAPFVLKLNCTSDNFDSISSQLGWTEQA